MTTPKIDALLLALEALFPAFRSTPAIAAVWGAELDGYSADELTDACRRLADGRVAVMPCLGDVIQALEGRWHKIAIARTDAQGGVYPSQTVGWHDVRVPPDRDVPLYLTDEQVYMLRSGVSFAAAVPRDAPRAPRVDEPRRLAPHRDEDSHDDRPFSSFPERPGLCAMPEDLKAYESWREAYDRPPPKKASPPISGVELSAKRNAMVRQLLDHRRAR